MGKTKTKTKSRSVGDSPKPPITIRSTNPKVIDDNIAKLEKAIQASGVSANPSGTAEETLLSSIGIDGKKYELGPSAKNTSYDNTDSELEATDTQGAIDELAVRSENIIIEDVASLFTYDTTYNIWATGAGALNKTDYTLIGINVVATNTNSPAACGISFQGGYGRIRGWDNTYTFIASAIWIKNS